jgi:hypothetical protein
MAYLCVSISTENERALKSAYDEQINATFSKVGGERIKRVYKAAHLTKQLKAKADDFIKELCENLVDEIAELDVYFCYFRRPFISAYGRGHGARFHPADFIKKNPDLFLHYCASTYVEKSGEIDESIQMDHFESDTTPAWRDLTRLKRRLEIYYSGGECNALISVADLVLRVIDLHQHGWVDPESVLAPIREHLPQLSKKMKYRGLGDSDEDLKQLVPDLKLSVPKDEYFKHPIFFVLWNPVHPRKPALPAFEWSPVYNATMSRAFDESGCVKNFAGFDEHIYWNKDLDYLVSWSPQEQELVEELRQMGYSLPTILTQKDLGLGEKETNQVAV